MHGEFLLMAVKELPREELELYATGVALILAKIIPPDTEVVDLYCTYTFRGADRVIEISRKIHDRIRELLKESN